MKTLFITLFLLISCSLMAQKKESPFYTYYESFRQEGFEKRRFTQSDLLPIVLSLNDQPGFSVSKPGKSVLGKDIYMLKAGSGPQKVLLWSQMHGDEPTATMAMMDIFKFLKQEGGPLDSLRQQLLNELTLYFIPMLNPDGADLYQRRNAMGIDINRDALRLQSPEARLLKSVYEQIQPDWAFNLHDKNILYSAGKSGKPATISFLAPPYDEAKSENAARIRAMKLIAEMNSVLEAYIPGQTGKWPDDFEPRAFGDNVQKWGASTVLIESGGYKDDPEKQYIRRLNFVAIMHGLLSVSTGSYTMQDLAKYLAIPPNERYFFNLLIRNVRMETEGEKYLMDIGINRAEKSVAGEAGFYFKSHIEDMGDLSVFYGYEELDAQGMVAVPGRIYPHTLKNLQALKKMDIHELLLAGYTAVRLQTLPGGAHTSFPVNLLAEGSEKDYTLRVDGSPDFVLKKDGEVRFAIVNGFIYNLRAKENGIKNALTGDP